MKSRIFEYLKMAMCILRNHFNSDMSIFHIFKCNKDISRDSSCISHDIIVYQSIELFQDILNFQHIFINLTYNFNNS